MVKRASVEHKGDVVPAVTERGSRYRPGVRYALALLLAVAVTAVAAGTGAARTSGACTAQDLEASFKVVPGSAGAGNIVYALVVTNRSAATCTVRGLPSVGLLSRNRKALPTHVISAMTPEPKPPLVALHRGASARATARFSPDVPGVGEGAAGKPCEPVASWLLLRAGGASTRVAITPPTSVCEHGRLQFTAYARG